MMNALNAARTIDFSDSLAFNPRLKSGIKASDVYRVGAEIAFGREETSTTLARIVGELKSRGCANDLVDALTPTNLKMVRLETCDLETLQRLTDIAANSNGDLQVAIEKAFAEDGNGVPAIAILIVAVVVFLVVFAV